MHRARELGIRVIVDIVMNHTSGAHPWFKAAVPAVNVEGYGYHWLRPRGSPRVGGSLPEIRYTRVLDSPRHG